MRTLIQWVQNSVRSIVHYFRPEAAEYYHQRNSLDVELGGLVEAVPEELPPTQPTLSAFQTARSLGSLVLSKENLPRIGGAAFLTALSTGVNFLAPYLLSETINLLNKKEEETSTVLGFELSREVLITLLITAYTLSQILPNIRDQIMIPVTNRNVKKIIERTTEHLLKKSLNYHINTPFPDQIFLLQKGFSTSNIGTPLLTQVAPTVVEIAIACSVLSSRYGLEMGIGLFGLLASYTSYSALTAKPIIQARAESLKLGNQSWEVFCGALTQYKTMRDFGKLDETMKAVSGAMEQMIQADNKASILPLKIGLGHYAISRGAMLIATLYIGLGIQSGKFTVAEFVFLVGYLNQLSGLLPAFGQAINQLFASYPDIKFVLGELAKPDEVIDLHPLTPLYIPRGIAPSIEFEGVDFSYPARLGEPVDPPLFQNLSFKVPGGQQVAFVSESGAGKTTIFNLLFGYYKPNRGTIKINNQDISQVSLNSLQNQITLFGQNPNLFKGSIRENICYGATHSKRVTDEMIWALARDTNLYDFLNAFPKKLDTDVGEGGKQLSGGQQQKVAILRALFKQSPIRLLDEITAPFDSQSAAQVLQSIDRSSHGITRLMITHKLTEAQFLDQIFVIDQGKVLDQGTHNQLLTRCALYQKLWSAYMKQQTQDTASTSPSSPRKMLEALGVPGPSQLELKNSIAPSASLNIRRTIPSSTTIEEDSEQLSSDSTGMKKGV